VKATWTARWNLRRETSLTAAFILALLLGGRVRSDQANPNVPGDMSQFDDVSLLKVVEEGRRQHDQQMRDFRHATDRAQTLLTISLVVLGFIAATLNRVLHAPGARATVALAIWALSILLTVVGVAAAAGVAVVAAEFKKMDTTIVSNFTPPILRELADNYAESVRLGQLTLDDRVTVFRQAVRFVSWGAILSATAFALAS